MATENPTVRVIRDRAFAERLNKACDHHPHVPPYNYGRLTWVRDHLNSDRGLSVTLETVRKWFSGESRPRVSKMAQLAELLGVDEAWLSLGLTPEATPAERDARNAAATGAVNLVAGIIQLSGGHPAFPDDGAPENLLAIIKGKHHRLHVTLGQQTDAGYRFILPSDLMGLVCIGVVQRGPLRFDFLRLDTDDVEKVGASQGGFIELAVKANGAGYSTRRTDWPLVKNFSTL